MAPCWRCRPSALEVSGFDSITVRGVMLRSRVVSCLPQRRCDDCVGLGRTSPYTLVHLYTCTSPVCLHAKGCVQTAGLGHGAVGKRGEASRGGTALAHVALQAAVRGLLLVPLDQP
jgi:hypothetical protein